MKSNPPNISFSSRPNGRSLFVGWILLVFIPALFFTHLFEQLLLHGEKQRESDATLELFSESDFFRKDLTYKVFLRDLFNETIDNHGHKIRGFSAVTVKNEIEFFSGQKIFASFIFAPQSEEVDSFIQPGAAQDFLISHRMLQNLFNSLRSGNTERLTNENRQKKQRGEAYLKSLLQTIGKMSIETRQIQPFISGKSALNRSYLYYFRDFPAEQPFDVIFLIRELDVKDKIVWQTASKKSTDKKFTRKFRLNDLSRENDEQNSFSLTNVIRDSSGLHFHAPLADETINRISTGKSFYPLNLDIIRKNYPSQKITVSAEGLKHELRRYFQPFKTFGFLLAIFSGLVCLRMYFFGYNFPLGLQSKITIAVFAASLLPVLALFLISGYQRSYNRNFRNFAMKNYLNQQVEEFNFAARSFRTSFESSNADLLYRLGFLKNYEFTPFFSRWIQNAPVTQVFTRIERHDGIIRKRPQDAPTRLEIDLRDLLFTTIENSFKQKNHEGILNDGSLGMPKIRIKGISTFFSNLGLLINSNFSNINNFYCILPVFPENNKFADVAAIFMLKYANDQLLQDFFKANKEFLMSDFKAGFKINKCFIPLENLAELPDSARYFISENFPSHLIHEKGLQILANQAEANWVEKHDKGTRIIHAEFSHPLNCIVLMVADQVNANELSLLPHPALTSVYFLILVAVVIYLLGRAFVAPVKLLQASAEAVSEGHLRQKIIFASRDEFDRLGQAYNQMIKGLVERETLSSFVSENVLEEVGSREDSFIETGGEKTQVSIVFCSLPDLKKRISVGDSETMLNYLGYLIDIADEVSRKNGGVIDKIIGDTVMMVFRQRDAGNSHVVSACQSALEIAAHFPAEQCPLRTSTGIASGEAVSGKIGAKEGKLDFTVIGNPVNLAARLKAQALMADQTGILLCPQTIRQLKGLGKLRFIERVEIKGRTRSFPMYELLSLRS